MNNSIKNIASFLINNPIWIFLTLLLGVAYMQMQSGQILSWGNFLGWTLVWTLLFLPVLLFAGFRDKLKVRLQTNLFLGLWISIFLLYPLLCLGLRLNQIVPDIFAALISYQKIDAFTFILVSGGILLLELLLQFSKKSGIPSKLSRWIIRLNIPRAALITVALFALLLPWISTYFQRRLIQWSVVEATGWYFYYAVQIFIIYGAYYLYYHIHHHILFNKLLKEKGLLYYGLGLIALLLILTPVYNQLFYFFPVVHDLKIHPVGLTESIFDDLNYTIPIGILVLTFPIILIVEWYKQLNTLTILEKEKAQAELSLLKQQINPHFFFNTLNNLYSMSLTKDAETPETILQLSELMRYVIYKGKEEMVKLSEDLKYIQDYIDLQQIRLHKNLDYSFEKNIENPSIKIPPLLFIIFVENAFKHGIEPAERKCFLNMKLTQEENHLDFTCHNSVESPAEKPPGIGLENLRRRLDILFPGQFDLSVKRNTNDYLARLKINL
jgi:hypothetical protein